jgi:diguanylate cyclase (GGDEF)-like protein
MVTAAQGMQRILVVGGGRGGTAMLDLFGDDPVIQIVGIFDANPTAPALDIARDRGVPVFTGLPEALAACAPCLVFNLTGDEKVTRETAEKIGAENILGGFQARFIWNLLTRLKQTNEQIAHLAYHDSLTGLPNRTLLYDRLNSAISRAHRDRESLAVLYLDLDGFKGVNDTYGHGIGDALLREASKRISSCVRESDTVARMGGDEFTVILGGVRAPLGNERVAKEIVEALANPFVLGGKSCMITVSIGVSLYPENGETADQLIKIADAAMYVAKNSGKNRYRFAEPGMAVTE